MTRPYRFAAGESRLLRIGETPQGLEAAFGMGAERTPSPGPEATARGYMARMARIGGNPGFMGRYRDAAANANFPQRWESRYAQPRAKVFQDVRRTVTTYAERAEGRERRPIVTTTELNKRLESLYGKLQSRPDLKESFSARYAPLRAAWLQTSNPDKREVLAVQMDNLVLEYEDLLKKKPANSPAPRDGLPPATQDSPPSSDKAAPAPEVPTEMLRLVEEYNRNPKATLGAVSLTARAGGLALRFSPRTYVDATYYEELAQPTDTWKVGRPDERYDVWPMNVDQLRGLLERTQCTLPSNEDVRRFPFNQRNALYQSFSLVPGADDTFNVLMSFNRVDNGESVQRLLAEEKITVEKGHFACTIKGLTPATFLRVLPLLQCADIPDEHVETAYNERANRLVDIDYFDAESRTTFSTGFIVRRKSDVRRFLSLVGARGLAYTPSRAPHEERITVKGLTRAAFGPLMDALVTPVAREPVGFREWRQRYNTDPRRLVFISGFDATQSGDDVVFRVVPRDGVPAERVQGIIKLFGEHGDSVGDNIPVRVKADKVQLLLEALKSAPPPAHLERWSTAFRAKTGMMASLDGIEQRQGVWSATLTPNEGLSADKLDLIIKSFRAAGVPFREADGRIVLEDPTAEHLASVDRILLSDTGRAAAERGRIQPQIDSIAAHSRFPATVSGLLIRGDMAEFTLTAKEGVSRGIASDGEALRDALLQIRPAPADVRQAGDAVTVTCKSGSVESLLLHLTRHMCNVHAVADGITAMSAINRMSNIGSKEQNATSALWRYKTSYIYVNNFEIGFGQEGGNSPPIWEIRSTNLVANGDWFSINRAPEIVKGNGDQMVELRTLCTRLQAINSTLLEDRTRLSASN